MICPSRYVSMDLGSALECMAEDNYIVKKTSEILLWDWFCYLQSFQRSLPSHSSSPTFGVCLSLYLSTFTDLTPLTSSMVPGSLNNSTRYPELSDGAASRPTDIGILFKGDAFRTPRRSLVMLVVDISDMCRSDEMAKTSKAAVTKE